MKWFLILFFVVLASCSGGKGGGGDSGVSVPSTSPPPAPVPSTSPTLTPAPTPEPVPTASPFQDPGSRYILGATRFSQESSRIPAGTISPWHAMDETEINTMFMTSHALAVQGAAELSIFGTIPPSHIRNGVSPFDPAVGEPKESIKDVFDSYDPNERDGYVVNISLGPFFEDTDEGKEESDTIIKYDIPVVFTTGNDGNGYPDHGDNTANILPHTQRALNTGRVLLVTGLAADKYEKHPNANGCGWAKVWCVAAPYTLNLPVVGMPTGGTSFSAPLVSSLLANARLLWPTMTSVQTIELGQWCARPVNADGTLNAWGSILTEAQADNNLGQGVFSVECLYASNGALMNPLRGVPLRGTAALRGTSSQIRLTDQFGRSYTQSSNGGGVVLPLLPIEQELPQQLAGYFFEKDKVMGVRLPYLNVGLRVDEDSFFSSKGYEDFELGDSVAMFVQLSYQFNFDNLDLNFYGLFVFSDMIASGGSIIRDAQGFSQQLTAQAVYDLEDWQLGAEVTHNFGVTGKLKLASHGEVKLSPESATQVRLSLRASF